MEQETITVTLDQLRLAFALWRTNQEAGNCLSAEEDEELTIEQHAERSASYMWVALGGSFDLE